MTIEAITTPLAAASGQLIGLDRILLLDTNRRAEAVRNVPSTLDIFDSHFPRFPVLPGVIILGTLGELAATLLRESTGFDWRTAEARTVRYRHFVQPGDVMNLSVELRSRDDSTALCSATASVDGKRVTTVGTLRMVPAVGMGA